MHILHRSLFPSIVTEVECDHFNFVQPTLIEWICNYQKTTDGVSISNRGGWQSPSDFYLDESFGEFVDYIVNNAQSALSFYDLELKLSNMWININKKGDYNVTHDHPLALISGVFWVKTPENCGSLVFQSPNSFAQALLLNHIDPEIAQQQHYDHSFSFTPKEGKMILFPANLLHLVEPNQSNEDRISIAFNLNV